jgi:hypothetical protein
MKKLLMVLGAIFAVLLILFAVVAVHGMADDRASKGYADDATVAIVSDWNDGVAGPRQPRFHQGYNTRAD